MDQILDILQPLGLHRKRARALVRLSAEYLAATTADPAAAAAAAAAPALGLHSPPPRVPTSYPPAATSPAITSLATTSSSSPASPAAATDPAIASRVKVPLRVPVASLHGVGVYAADAHAMFCQGLLSAGPYISRCLRELALQAVCP